MPTYCTACIRFALSIRSLASTFDFDQSSSYRLMIFCSYGCSFSGKICNRPSLTFRSLFFGNMPDTACLMISAESLSNFVSNGTVFNPPIQSLVNFLFYASIAQKSANVFFTRIRAMRPIYFLFIFLPRYDCCIGVCDDDVISHVGCLLVYGFMFSH